LGPGIQPLDVVLDAPSVVPHNSTVPVTVTGKMFVSQHDVHAGFAALKIKLYDQDFAFNDLLDQLIYSCPAGSSTPGTLVDFALELYIVNLDGQIQGAGEFEAELFATVLDPAEPGNEVWTLIYEVVAL
jgi:hypothetical protein